MRAVLFDLDGTLLDIELGAFLRRYFSALREEMVALGSALPGDDVMSAVMASTEAMMSPHPGVTNRQAFNSSFLSLTGVDLDDEWEVLGRFYREVFPMLGDGCVPMAGAKESVTLALELGLRVAIATNPIFPMEAVLHRLTWAGLDGVDLHAITTYEVMHACKPSPEYFSETAQMLGVSPEECLMVGDDRTLDLAAADVGMRTFYVGPDPRVPADFRGTLEDLTRLLPRLLS